ALRQASKAAFATGYFHPRGERQPEGVVAVHEHLEHGGAADDRDHAGTHAGGVRCGFEGGSGGVPERGLGIGGIGCQRSHFGGDDEPLALRRGRVGFGGMAGGGGGGGGVGGGGGEERVGRGLGVMRGQMRGGG